MGGAFIPLATEDPPGKADAVDPPADPCPVPEVPAEAEEPTPAPIPPVGDETTPAGKVDPSAEFASAEVVPAEAAPPDKRCAFDATAFEILAGPGAWAVMSDALVPSRSDALPSKSILKGCKECRYKYAKFHCHKKSVWAVIETRRNQEKRVVSMLPNGPSEERIRACASQGSMLSTMPACRDQGISLPIISWLVARRYHTFDVPSVRCVYVCLTAHTFIG